MFPVHYGALVDAVVQARGLERAKVVEAMLGAARAASQRHLGTETPIDAEMVGESGLLRVVQVLAVVAEVDEPARQLALVDARRLDPEVEVGDALAVTIDFTHDPREAARREGLMAVADRLPLPLWSEGLWEALGSALNELLMGWLPPAEPPAGSLWACLAGGGGWLVGQVAAAAGATWRRWRRSGADGSMYMSRITCPESPSS